EALARLVELPLVLLSGRKRPGTHARRVMHWILRSAYREMAESRPRDAKSRQWSPRGANTRRGTYRAAGVRLRPMGVRAPVDLRQRALDPDHGRDRVRPGDLCRPLPAVWRLGD